MSEEVAYVRLKPYDPKRKNVRERFRMGAACGWNDLEFVAGKVMELDVGAAKWLHENIRQRDDNPLSQSAFDIWFSKAELAAALRKEKLDAMGWPQAAKPKKNKPPELKHVSFSDLDEPPATSAIEAEMVAKLNREIEAQDNTDFAALAVEAKESKEEVNFSDLAPGMSDDDLISAALADSQPEAPAAPPKPRRKKRGK